MFALCLESSHARGMGHLYRGLTLLDGLRARGHHVQLIMNDHAPSLAVARVRGYAPVIVDVAETNEDWESALIRERGITCWVNDRLDTEAVHATRVVRAGARLATFDDTGSGAALSQLHIAALKPADMPLGGARVLRGIAYLILNPEIGKYRRLRTELTSILITLGGSDTYGVTVPVVRALAQAGRRATVVIGPAFEHRDALQSVVTESIVIRDSVPSMAQEMAAHDLAITGGGVTPFEACAAGLPCIIIANEWFEVPNGKLLESLGCAVFAGHHSVLDTSFFTKEMNLANMSRNGLEKVGLDGLTRVIDALETLA